MTDQPEAAYRSCQMRRFSPFGNRFWAPLHKATYDYRKSPRGAYLISGPKRGALVGERGLIERGGGAYFKSHIFDEIHNNFPYFTIIPITRTEQENNFLSPFYKCKVICTLIQRYC